MRSKKADLKIVTHPAVIALGVVSLCSFNLTAPLVAPKYASEIYHLKGSASALLLPIGIDFCILWLLITGFLYFSRRPGRPYIYVWSGLILLLPAMLLRSWAPILGWSFPHQFTIVFITSFLALVATLAFWRPSFLPVFTHVQQFVATLLGFSSLIGVMVLSQLVWVGWQTRNLESPPILHQRPVSSGPTRPHPRVVWILFDELSYNQVFARRFAGLQLHSFDQLAAQSTVFTQVTPAGFRTEKVLPSLMTGVPVDLLRVSNDGQLLALHNPVSDKWQAFDPHQTVFQDALNLGYGTAIAGWSNPYCSMLPEVLDQCFWTARAQYPGQMSLDQSLLQNCVGPFHELVSSAISYLLRRSGPTQFETSGAEMHIADYQDLLSAGDRMLSDSSLDFILLHMPIPHPGGIYDRKRGTFTTSHSSYLDNLALTDQYLGHVRQVLEQQGQWDSSAIVVMGDHSWRTSLWSLTPGLTTEEQAASKGGQFDDRPAYIVKLPHQHVSKQIGTPFKAIYTRALLDQIFEQNLLTADDLQSWVKQQK